MTTRTRKNDGCIVSRGQLTPFAHKMSMVIDTLGNSLALHVTPANEHDRAPVKVLAEQVQASTGKAVKAVSGDQGYTGTRPA